MGALSCSPMVVSMQTKLRLILLALKLCLIASLLYWMAGSYQQLSYQTQANLYRQSEEIARLMTQHAAREAGLLLERQEEEGLSRLVNSMAESPYLDSVRLYDRNGELKYSSGEDQTELHPDNGVYIGTLSPDGARQGFLRVEVNWATISGTSDIYESFWVTQLKYLFFATLALGALVGSVIGRYSIYRRTFVQLYRQRRARKQEVLALPDYSCNADVVEVSEISVGDVIDQPAADSAEPYSEQPKH